MMEMSGLYKDRVSLRAADRRGVTVNVLRFLGGFLQTAQTWANAGVVL